MMDTDDKTMKAAYGRMLDRLSAINRLHQELLVPGPLSEKLLKVTDSVISIFDADFCRIWLTKQGDLCETGCVHAKTTEGPHVCRMKDRCLHLAASSGRYTHTDGEVHRRVPFGCYKIGLVASDEERKFVINNVAEHPRIHNKEWARESGLVSFAGYQLRPPGGMTLGVLALFSKHPIMPEEDTSLEGISNTVAQVVQNAAMEDALQTGRETFRSIVEGSRDGIVMINTRREVQYANEAAERMLGYAPGSLTGLPFLLLWKEGGTQEIDILRYDGASGIGDMRTVATSWEGASAFLISIRDVTERKTFENQLLYLANNDALSGLYNRRRVQEQLVTEVAIAKRYGASGALIYFDIDHFKVLNDRYGHQGGDRVLKALAVLLKRLVRETDTVGRLGGDEFIILCPRTDQAEAYLLVHRLLKEVREFAFDVEGKPVYISISIGATFFSREGFSPDVLMTQVDTAMYRAKQSGRDCATFFSPNESAPSGEQKETA